ncbi:EAL domain-containing protein [Shewanella schlegeliana]|uniref:EAL domain-containing protein n=2 Tax=Shewanella schlegeliana TaxID=190308 RepID=A0ABS1T212_9GAMM|nr:EAL domain-containing protein [Shewanella schlegeliana]
MQISEKLTINPWLICLLMTIFSVTLGMLWIFSSASTSPVIQIIIPLLLSANIALLGGLWLHFHHLSSQSNDESSRDQGSVDIEKPPKAQSNVTKRHSLNELKAKQLFKNKNAQELVQKEVQTSEPLLEAVLESAAVAIYAIDDKGKCIFANPLCAQLLGYSSPEQLLNFNIHELIYQSSASTEMAVPLGNGEVKEDIFWRADGSSFPVDYKSQPLALKGNKNGAVISFYDNSERRDAEALIRHQAHYDTLTELPNRFLALKRLEQLVEASERNGQMLAVIFLDLDDFKKINDSLGHEAGDQLLISASKRLLNATRAEDTVGRLGGDEFIILLDGLSSASDAQPLAENLIGGFRKPFYIDNRQLVLTASIGIAIYPNDGLTPSELLRNADSAMYHTKSIGRNTYSYFTHAMNKEVSRRLAIEEQIHGALERGELQAHFQIQLDIRDGSIMGAEALLRWNNPALGNVSPAEFIPIAEQTGVIEPMGEFILTRALEAARIWQNKFNDNFRVAINLSPRQFRNPNLVQSITDQVNTFGMRPEDLELEITEGVLLSGHAYTLDALKQLSDAGFCISMDDFGTGYSSLSYLRTYPFEILKIDRSFISDMNKDGKSNELIIATIEMAHALGIRVIAEGVETQEQLDELSFMMCDYAQGFLISKPVPFDELLEIGIHYKEIHENLATQENPIPLTAM